MSNIHPSSWGYHGWVVNEGERYGCLWIRKKDILTCFKRPIWPIQPYKRLHLQTLSCLYINWKVNEILNTIREKPEMLQETLNTKQAENVARYPKMQ